MPPLTRGKKRGRSESGPAPGSQLQLDNNDVIGSDESQVRLGRRYNLRNRRFMAAENGSDVDSSGCSRPLKVPRVSEPAAEGPKEAEAEDVREPDSEEDEEADISQQLKDELTCSVCLDLCYEPCTVSCSHTFCKSCLLHSLRACGSRCPKCRGELNLGRKGPLVNFMIWNSIQLLFPNECAKRKRAIDEEKAHERTNDDVGDQLHDIFTIFHEW